jgi:hypothetical protein
MSGIGTDSAVICSAGRATPASRVRAAACAVGSDVMIGDVRKNGFPPGENGPAPENSAAGFAAERAMTELGEAS